MGTRQSESLQDALNILAISEGYILRTDGVAVGLAEVTPPDLELLDDHALEQLVHAYETVLQATSERIILTSYPVAPDMRPLLRTLAAAQATAPDLTSFTVLKAMQGLFTTLVATSKGMPSLRWIIAVPSVQPEVPPRGIWGELQPAYVAGRIVRLSGDPISEALNRVRRLIGQLSALGTEPPPRLLSAWEIRAVLALGLDPIHAQAHPPSIPDEAVRPLQIASDSSAPGIARAGDHHGRHSATPVGNPARSAGRALAPSSRG